MANRKSLVLTFGTENGKQASMALRSPKDNLDEQTVRTAMQGMITANIFANSEGSHYTTAQSAKVVEVIETAIIE